MKKVFSILLVIAICVCPLSISAGSLTQSNPSGTIAKEISVTVDPKYTVVIPTDNITFSYKDTNVYDLSVSLDTGSTDGLPNLLLGENATVSIKVIGNGASNAFEMINADNAAKKFNYQISKTNTFAAGDIVAPDVSFANLDATTSCQSLYLKVADWTPITSAGEYTSQLTFSIQYNG